MGFRFKMIETVSLSKYVWTDRCLIPGLPSVLCVCVFVPGPHLDTPAIVLFLLNQSTASPCLRESTSGTLLPVFLNTTLTQLTRSLQSFEQETKDQSQRVRNHLERVISPSPGRDGVLIEFHLLRGIISSVLSPIAENLAKIRHLVLFLLRFRLMII